MQDNFMRLDGRVTIVTGGGSGIGKAIAELFAARGARVWIGDLDQAAAETTAAGIVAGGGLAQPLPLDVADAGSVSRAFTAVTAAAGRLDILVNNAGVSHIGTVVESAEDDWHRVMAVNAKGVFLCAKAAVAQMCGQDPRGGVIVNMASIASLIGIASRFLYSASKGAVLQMTRCIAVDHVQDNIRCNCICPARVHTPFVDNYLATHYPGAEQAMYDKLSAYQPIGRMGRPDEIATLALYLASDEAGFVTGAAYPIDGGVTAQ